MGKRGTIAPSMPNSPDRSMEVIQERGGCGKDESVADAVSSVVGDAGILLDTVPSLKLAHPILDVFYRWRFPRGQDCFQGKQANGLLANGMV